MESGFSEWENSNLSIHVLYSSVFRTESGVMWTTSTAGSSEPLVWYLDDRMNLNIFSCIYSVYIMRERRMVEPSQLPVVANRLDELLGRTLDDNKDESGVGGSANLLGSDLKQKRCQFRRFRAAAR